MGSSQILFKTEGRSLPAFLLFCVIGSFFFVIALNLLQRPHKRPINYNQALQEVCELVYRKHYQGPAELQGWHRDCIQPIGSHLDINSFLKIVRDRLGRLRSSHLEIYSPEEDQKVWAGRSAGDNGLRIQGVNGRIYLTDVLPGSSARRAGLQKGDQIVSIDGGLVDGDSLRLYEGQLLVVRNNKEYAFQVRPEPLQIDFRPQLSSVAPQLGHLKISSFRKEYFQKKEWQQIALELNNYKKIIVDLRGNLGGDFNSVVRALTTFTCKDLTIQSFGVLERPTFLDEKEAFFVEDLSEEAFYSLLESHRRILLKPFDGHHCFQGTLVVLIDENTASVSEIFAAVIGEQVKGALVRGQKSRGDLLLGVWYPLKELRGYTLSIPESVYLTPKSFVVEGRGVQPKELLYYDENALRVGRDNWLQ